MATHSSTLAWEIPWTEEPGGLQSMGSQKSWTGLYSLNSNKRMNKVTKSLGSVDEVQTPFSLIPKPSVYSPGHSTSGAKGRCRGKKKILPLRAKIVAWMAEPGYCSPILCPLTATKLHFLVSLEVVLWLRD